jgi:hypothetical protein
MEGTITNIEDKNGKRRVAVDGKWYGTSKCKPDPAEMQKGLRIQFEGNSWEYQGKTFWGINKWRAIGEVPQNAQGRAQTASTIMDGDILRSVSNVVGNACSAGTIANADELHYWISTAYAAFTNMGKAQIPAGGSQQTPGSAPKGQEEPPLDDSDAFYEGRHDEDGPPW